MKPMQVVGSETEERSSGSAASAALVTEVQKPVGGRLERARPGVWWAAQAWQTNAALVFLGLLLFLLSRHLTAEYESYTIGFSGTSGWSVWCYALASALVLFGPTNRWTLPIILSVAGVCRLATLFADPFLSSDIYRYVWDGIVQHARVNPYRYVPADTAIAYLRGASDGNIFPMINRATYAHTIYPPVAQMIFWLSTLISPTVTCMKAVMVLFECVTAAALIDLLRSLGRRREEVILFAWCPLLVWEIAGSGHLDAAVFAWTTLALVARYRRWPTLTGVFLGLAVLTKFYPLVLFPALYTLRGARDGDGRARGWMERLEWRMPAAMVAVTVVGYAIYSSVGMRVFGFLGGYVQEEGMSTGTRYFLLEQVQHLPRMSWVSPEAYVLFAGLVMAALSLWALRVGMEDEDSGRRAKFLGPTVALAVAMMLLFSPHYPWYVAWLVPLFTILPVLPVGVYILGLFYLCTTALAVGYGPKQFLLNQILYGSVLMATAVWMALRRWQVVDRLRSL